MFVNLGDLRFILFNKCTVMQLAARAMQNIGILFLSCFVEQPLSVWGWCVPPNCAVPLPILSEAAHNSWGDSKLALVGLISISASNIQLLHITLSINTRQNSFLLYDVEEINMSK